MKLIIARHGNTFTADQTPTRVGARTDMPLGDKGHQQAMALGAALKAEGLFPDRVYVSQLKRTQQTAEGALRVMNIEPDVEVSALFDEVDYGPDENKEESTVIARIGEKAILDWDNHAIVPDGWLVDPEQMKLNWIKFSNMLAKDCKDKTILVVTSNGTARFAQYILDDQRNFEDNHSLKLSTGAYGVFEFYNDIWSVKNWNIRPK